MAQPGFDAIITRDQNQLRDPAERQAYVHAALDRPLTKIDVVGGDL